MASPDWSLTSDTETIVIALDGAVPPESSIRGLLDRDLALIYRWSGASQPAVQRNAELAALLADRHVVGIAFFSRRDKQFAMRNAGQISELLRVAPSLAFFLVPPRSAPTATFRVDEPAESFVVPAQAFTKIIDGRPESAAEACYLAAQTLFSVGGRVDQLFVVPLDRCEFDRSVGDQTTRTTLVLPHRGPLDMLEACLHYIARQTTLPRRIQVCVDDILGPRHRDLWEKWPTVEWFHTAPPGVGPYLPRQQLAMRAESEFITFQDSDDLPCSDRIRSLLRGMDDQSPQLLGSHELRLDEFQRLALPIRYPLDVTKALSRGPAHALLHPTSMVSRSAFQQSGGLSTNRAIANDTQFLLRAFFCMPRIRNVDAFLYVKRDRRGSLTRLPKIGRGSEVRQELAAAWEDAFRRVAEGSLPLDASALAVDHGPADNQVKRL